MAAPSCGVGGVLKAGWIEKKPAGRWRTPSHKMRFTIRNPKQEPEVEDASTRRVNAETGSLSERLVGWTPLFTDGASRAPERSEHPDKSDEDGREAVSNGGAVAVAAAAAAGRAADTALGPSRLRHL